MQLKKFEDYLEKRFSPKEIAQIEQQAVLEAMAIKEAKPLHHGMP